MRWLIVIVTGLFLLWSGYWLIGSRTALGAIETWVADAPAKGIPVTTGQISLAGYPNRFDVTVLTPEFADPVSGITWKAPFLQALALSYRPWNTIIVLPQTQTLSRPGETLTLANEKLRANFDILPETNLGFDRFILEGDALQLSSDLGWTFGAKHGVVALRKDVSRLSGYEFGLQVNNVALDPALVAKLAAGSKLPPEVESTTADIMAVLSAPLDRNAATTKPQIEGIEVKKVQIIWGDLQILADGQLSPDATGKAEGRISIKITGWEHLAPLLVALGAIKPELEQTATNMMEAIAKSGPDPRELSVPLTMAEGWMTLGPLPLGPAPSLRAQAGL